MKKNKTVKRIEEINTEAIRFIGLNDAIVGIGKQHGMNDVAIYDRQKCIDILEKTFRECPQDDYDPYLQAIEHFEFNVECAYFGPNTPIIIERLENNEY